MKYLTEKQVSRILDEKISFRLAEEAFLLLEKKKAGMPPKIYLNLPHGNDFRAMPAYYIKDRQDAACGVKWVNVYPHNRSRGLPTVAGTILLNDIWTGKLLAVMEAGAITAFRTAAASAVASFYLARRQSQTLSLVGAGLQAEHHLKALTALFPIREVAIWGFKKGEAKFFCRRHSRSFPSILFKPRENIEEAVKDADLIITCTPSRKPLVKSAWIKEGAHLNAVGADAKGKEELEPQLLRRARVIVDEWEQASHSGEINVPVNQGLFKRKNLHAQLGEIVSGKKRGRLSEQDITIFDSTGLAVLDVYFARYVWRATARQGKTKN